MLGDVLVRHIFQETMTVIFVKLHKCVGSYLSVKMSHHIFRLIIVKVLKEFGDVGRVKLFEQLFYGLLVVFLNKGNKLFVYFQWFFHAV